MKKSSHCHKHPNADASVRCSECNLCFCVNCEKEFHKVFFPNHRSQPLAPQRSHVPPASAPPPPPPPPPSSTTSKRLCSKHEKYPLEMFCVEDNSLCCLMCVYERKIDKSKVLKIEDALGARRSDMESCKSWIEKEREKIYSLCEGIDTTSTDIETRKGEILARIRTSFDKIHSAVEEREKAVICEVEKCFGDVDSTADSADVLNTLDNDMCTLEENICELLDEWDKGEKCCADILARAIAAENECKKLVNDSKAKLRTVSVGNGSTVSVECDGPNLDKLLSEVAAFGNVFIGESDPNKSENPPLTLQCAYNGGWKGCSYSVDSKRRYIANRVATFTGEGAYGTVIGTTPIAQGTVASWAVKIVKSRNNNGDWIWVGVAPADVDQNADGSPTKCGWYLCCYDVTLYSGPPHNYNKKEFYRKKKNAKSGSEVGIVLDLTEHTGKMSFSLDGKDLGVGFIGIPLDKPLVPAAVLRWTDDTIEIKKPCKV